MTDIVQIGDATLYHGDCLEILPTLEKVQAILLDPQYDAYEEILNKLSSLLDNDEMCCLAMSQPPFDSQVRKFFCDRILREIIWYFPKLHKWSSHALPLASHYKIAWIPAKDRFFNKRPGVSYSKHTAEGDKGYMVFEGYREKLAPFSKHKDGRHLADVILMDRELHTGGIPKKPVKLFSILIKAFFPQGLIVHDPFMGSGTSGVACANLGRKFIGIEIDRKCFDIACERIEAAYTQRLD